MDSTYLHTNTHTHTRQDLYICAHYTTIMLKRFYSIYAGADGYHRPVVYLNKP